MFGQKITRNQLRSVDGGAFQGIQFPPFIGPARITGIYIRNGSNVTPVQSPFNADREFVGGIGTDVNLLRDGFDGPTILIENNDNGDITYIINKDCIDFSKVPDPSSGGGCVCNPGDTESTNKFNNTEFIVECTLFAFDRGFLETNGRFLLARNSGVGDTDVNTFLSPADNRVGVVVPAPLSVNSVNNELTFYYSRQPGRVGGV